MCIRDRWIRDRIIEDGEGEHRETPSPGVYDHQDRALLLDGDITDRLIPVSYTHLRAHETVLELVCRLLLEKKKSSVPYASQGRF
mgnify:CR=1 FL=1